MPYIYDKWALDLILPYLEAKDAPLEPAILEWYIARENINANKEQIHCLAVAIAGHNMLITGSAGTGKSYVIGLLQSMLPRYNRKITTTAMTGGAAVIIKGQTFHSVSGFGICTKFEEIAQRIRKTNKIGFWTNINCLIIDEVSMLSMELFDIICKIAQLFRGNALPFGGMQVILVGDFCQLPHVKCTRFCFESELFEKFIATKIELKQIFRQHNTAFTKCLNNIRIGKPTSNDIALIEKCKSNIVGTDLIKPTILYPTNDNVNLVNTQELGKLKDIKAYKAATRITTNRILTENVKQHYMRKLANINIDEVVRVAIGAQVILKINLDVEKGLCNGSRGVVIDFDKYPVVQFLNNEKVLIRPFTWEYEENSVIVQKRQLPLKLAYAISIHGSQGCTLDCVSVDIGDGVFQAGQTYTALSRVRDPSGLHVISFDPKKIKCSRKVSQFLKKL